MSSSRLWARDLGCGTTTEMSGTIDEYLCPSDYATAGLLQDDDMNDLLHLFN
jgi:hypothetical protein